MTIIDRALSVVGLQRKADDLPILTYQQQALWWPTWAWGASTLTPATWQTLTPLTLAEYYMTNPVVHACVRVYAESFSQARLKTYNSKDGEEIPNHPLTRLFQRPNELMGQSEFWRYVAAYILYGGNGYAHLLPSVAGGKRGVAEMWPYNVNQMVPIPSMQKWVDHYAYNLGNGDWKDVPSQEVVQARVEGQLRVAERRRRRAHPRIGSSASSRRKSGTRSSGASARSVRPPSHRSPSQASVQVAPAGR